ncbi:MAG: UDP-N-acetylmuramoyl-L-alanyl-D-glutamate--2,6-diaminopimelate ligase [Clostridia bacterium]|nr:UDP-N-acetylmuramoyl-L-alanyl-D-glutamate--2,6-diaminopimelate ligase [Clostridia bacterium]
MKNKNLNEIIDLVGAVQWGGDMSGSFKGIQHDSRKVSPGDIFLAIKGHQLDGHDFIPQAVCKGAAAVILEGEIQAPENTPWIKVKNSRLAMSRLAALLNNHPSRFLRVIGVTGTNGKTTITYLIERIFQEAGKRTGLVGTIENRILEVPQETDLTTPDSPELHALLSKMVKEKVEIAIMETSSHALKLKRVEDCLFDIAVFTNLTQDHMDFHSDFDDYLNSKALLFRNLHLGEKTGSGSKYAVVNIDDAYASQIIHGTKVPIIYYGIENDADYRAFDINTDFMGTSFTVKGPGVEKHLDLKLIGRFNVYNALAACAAAFEEGIDPHIVQKALKETTVPGRFEIIDEGQGFAVVVDYAHTPDGLKNILETAREITPGRIITVFGCGGDRDKKKRPLMGKMAAGLSDFTVVTSDNPRSEVPGEIIKDIIPGVKEAAGEYSVIESRREAIAKAVTMAKDGDMVIIAGKGHETYQLIHDEVLHFDDRETAREILRGLG